MRAKPISSEVSIDLALLILRSEMVLIFIRIALFEGNNLEAVNAYTPVNKKIQQIKPI